MRKSNRSGFTLLEVIIVIIIVGVLASLALPRFFSTVEYSKGTEALQALATVRQSMERCYMMRISYSGPCANFNNLYVENPTNTPNAHFTYAINGGVTAYTITSTRNTRDGGDGTSTVILTFNGTTVTRTGSGSYGAVN